MTQRGTDLMTTNQNRIMTIKERYLLFKERNTNNEIAELLELIEEAQDNPNEHASKYMESYKKSIQDQIEELPEDDQELIERLYHFASFNGKKAADSGLTKWDFFVETARKNNWTPVIKMIDLIIENDELFEKIRTGAKDVSDTVLEEQQMNDKKDLEKLETMLEKEVLPWAKKNVSSYYQDMIARTMHTRLRTIQNRLKRNTDLAFSEWLRNTRKEKGMTLQEVAERSNTSTSYIQRLEKGKRKVPSLPILQNIADALNVPHQEVLDIISGKNNTEEAVSFLEIVRQRNYTLKGQEVGSEQRLLLENLIRAALNENNKSEVDNLIELPNLARELRNSVEKIEQEDMSDDTN